MPGNADLANVNSEKRPESPVGGNDVFSSIARVLIPRTPFLAGFRVSALSGKGN